MSLLKSLMKESEEMMCKQGEGLVSSFLGADLELDVSKENEISLYLKDKIVLSVEHGVTLGLLKLIYSSDTKSLGELQGVRSRHSSDPSAVPTVILSDDRVLDGNAFDMIIQENTNMSNTTDLPSSPLTAPLPTSISININNEKNGDKKKGQFVCEYCHLPFISKAKFQRHRRIHTDEKPYVCACCKETFSHHLDLRKHRDEKHVFDKPFKCSYCPKTFSTKAELRGHMWRHTGEKNHKCRICAKMFATKGNLKLHVDKHIGLHKHKCPFCSQKFTSHSSLEAHMAKHTGMKSYKCRYCSKSYAQAGQLTSHERLHTGEKPFVCEVCGKGFRLNSTRLAHEKRHSGARPHICETCGRSFAMPDHLRRHMKTHENKSSRLVSCPFCRKKIFQGRNMRKHLFRHRELNLTDIQAKMISASLKPDSKESGTEMHVNDPKLQSKKILFQCQHCNEEFKTIRKLYKHLSDFHFQREMAFNESKEMRLQYGPKKMHKCQFCNSSFMDICLLRSHVVSEHPPEASRITSPPGQVYFRCQYCLAEFSTKSSLDDHEFKEHLSLDITSKSEKSNQILQFTCWYCNDNFGTPEEVVGHMTTKHESLDVLSKRVEESVVGDSIMSSLDSWACNLCYKSLKSESEYNLHVASHSLSSNVDELTGNFDTFVDKDSFKGIALSPEELQGKMVENNDECNVPAKPDIEMKQTPVEGNKEDSLKCNVPFKPDNKMKQLSVDENKDDALKCNVPFKPDIEMKQALVEESKEDALKYNVPFKPDNRMEQLSVDENTFRVCHNDDACKKSISMPKAQYENYGFGSFRNKDHQALYLNGNSGSLCNNVPDHVKMLDNKDIHFHVDEMEKPNLSLWNCVDCQKDFQSKEEYDDHRLSHENIFDTIHRNGTSTPTVEDGVDNTEKKLNKETQSFTSPERIKMKSGSDDSTGACNTNVSIRSTHIGRYRFVNKSTASKSGKNYLKEEKMTSVINEESSRSSGRKAKLKTPSNQVIHKNKVIARETAVHVINTGVTSTSEVSRSVSKACLTTKEVERCGTNTHSSIIEWTKVKKQKTKETYNLKEMNVIIPKLKVDPVNKSSCYESCKYCPDLFKSKVELKAHLNTNHKSQDAENIPFRCWFCDLTFPTPEEVVQHMTKTHDNLDNLSRCIEAPELKTQLRPSVGSQKTIEANTIPVAEDVDSLSSQKDGNLRKRDNKITPKMDLNVPEKIENEVMDFEEDSVVLDGANSSKVLETDNVSSTSHLIHSLNFPLSVEKCEPRHLVSSCSSNGDAQQMMKVEEPISKLPWKKIDIESVSHQDFPTKSSSNGNFADQNQVVSNPIIETKNNSSLLEIEDKPIKIKKSTSLSHTDISEYGLNRGKVKRFEKQKIKVDKILITHNISKSFNESNTRKSNKTNSFEESLAFENKYNKNISLNSCSHCSRTFCTKRALDVHTFKMHREEIRKSQAKSAALFSCWFCSSNFKSPEEVVEHMTSKHENLDSLSKRVEDQGVPLSQLNSQSKIPILVPPTDYAAQQKSQAYQKKSQNVLNLATTRSSQQRLLPVLSPKALPSVGQLQSISQVGKSNCPPPEGFKMSYALAYVPVYVPEQSGKVLIKDKKL